MKKPFDDENSYPPLGAVMHGERRYIVTVRIGYDGIEHVGRLWFADDSWEDTGFPDRSAIPGRTVEEVLERARLFSQRDFDLRFRRALAEKRRFIGLRKVTDEILSKIRYLNQLALSMRAGLLDVDGAAQEIDLTERQLHEIVSQLRRHAGVEGP